MSQTVNILHLSDLHYKRGTAGYNQGVVMDALKQDLHNVCSGLLKPDLIVFSGDIVSSGDDEDIFVYFHEDHLEEIAKITRCDESRIFLCPGNHDAQREVIKKRREEQAKLARDLKGRDELNTAYLDGHLNDLVNEKFSKFREYLQLLDNPEPIINDSIVRVVQVDGLPVDIVCLNTAWMTWAGIEEYGGDQRKLMFPEAALQKAIDNCNPAHFQVFVAHHPVSWFTEFAERDFINTLKAAGTNPYLYLHGHLHDPQPKQIKGLNGESLVCQSGALYSSRDWYNGYSIISFDLDDPQFVVHLRSYSDKSRQFSSGVDVAPPDGQFFSSEQAKTFWSKFSQQVERESVKSWLGSSLLPAAKTTYDEGLTDRPLCDVFVPPPMYLRTEFHEGKGEDLPERREISINISDIGSSGENYIIQGRQEYGKTTLLQQIALHLMEKGSDEIDSLTVPIVIDFASINPGREPVRRALQRGLMVELPSGASLTNLLDEGLVTILIDDVEFADSTRIKLLKDFITKNLRNKFIFTTSGGKNILLEDSLATNAETLISFENVFLKPFTRGKMRTLVQKWDGLGGVDQEALLNRIIREMASMHIPVTAVNGSILLTIYEDQTNFAPINRTALIEHFVEHVLEKRSVKETIRGTFDFLNKVHLLARLAEHMARGNCYVLTQTEVIQIFRAFLNQVGLAQNEESILRHFIEARIIAERPENTVSFRYRAFLEYFIAFRIKIDPRFRDWVLSDQNYLSFRNELHYYAGMERTDQNLLDLVGKRFDTLTEDLFKEIEWDPDLTKIESFVLPSDKPEEDLFDDLARQLELPPLGEKDRDEVLDGEIPRDAQERQEVFRPVLKESGQRWTAALLLYSGVLKNLDLIPDTVKRGHLSAILKAWGYFTVQSLFIVPMLAKHRRLRINGVLYEVLLPPHLTDVEAARAIYMELPNALSYLVMWHLGTEKLQVQLVEPTLSESNESLISIYYRHTLIADLRFPGWPEALIGFSRTLKNSPYLQEMLLRKMTGIYLLGGHKPDTEGHLKELIADVLSELRSKGSKDRKRIKSRAIQQIEQRAFVRRLKIAAQEKSEI